MRELLHSLPSSPFKVVEAAIVPDEQAEIHNKVLEWCNAGVDLVLTSGGTGFGVRDGTPEVSSQLQSATVARLTPALPQAVASLIHKAAPGLVHQMLSSSLAITPLAALSRPVAGVFVKKDSKGEVVGGTLIVTLPGSPKGATENLQSLLKLLPHTLDLVRGGSGRAVHKELGAPDRAAPAAAAAPALSHGGGCGHDHGHGHAAPRSRTLLSQDPSTAIAARQRQSPYPLVPLRDAISLIFEHTYVSPVQTVPVEDSLVGYVLADDVQSAQNIPPRPSTNVDGYAVRCELSRSSPSSARTDSTSLAGSYRPAWRLQGHQHVPYLSSPSWIHLSHQYRRSSAAGHGQRHHGGGYGSGQQRGRR